MVQDYAPDKHRRKASMKTAPFNLAIIGSQKSSTTSLHDALAQHPSVFMSFPIKEPCYFFPDNAFLKRLESYGHKAKSRREASEKFIFRGYRGEKIVGESSTSYTMPNKHNIAQSMKAHNEGMKFIFIARHPIKRIISCYWHHVKWHNFVGSLDDFMKTRAGLIAVETSKYSTRIKDYLNTFPREHFHFLTMEGFVADQKSELSKVYEFLGVEDYKGSTDVHSNETGVGREKVVFSREIINPISKVLSEEIEEFSTISGLTPGWDMDPVLFTS